MQTNNLFNKKDISSGLVVFLVAVPLCLGIALASGAPLYSGMITGMVGGIIVTLFSKSQLSVAGPAAGLTAIVISSIQQLGGFETFLLAVFVAGLIQVVAGFLKAGTFANFIPSNVISGMLTGIGIIIILKQLPHAVGYDKDSEGDFYFLQSDGENTFSELYNVIGKIDVGASVLTLMSLALLLFWKKIFSNNKKVLPGELVVVAVSILFNELSKNYFPLFSVDGSHLVNIPVSKSAGEFFAQFTFPDFTQWQNPYVYTVALTIAVVASIETLLSLEAVDKIDPEKRYSPPNNELKAQGIGNMLSGLIGGLPLTSVIVRSSVNINAGAKTKASSFFHGVLLLSSVALFPQLLNKIPLASLAAILLVTGYKLADPSVFKKIYAQGKHQFIPFAVTIVAVVFTDLLTGVLIGLGISIFSVLRVNYKNPYYYQLAKQNDKDIIKIELAQEVSFLNKANIQVTLNDLPENSTVIIDAHRTKYIDSDVTEIIKEFRDIKSPQKKIKSLLVGFDEASNLSNTKLFSPEETVLDPLQRTKVIQDKLTPSQAIHILKEGNYRFVNHLKINRNLLQQVNSTSDAQYPFAAILSCIDSRTSAELIFDQGLGDIFSIRIAGNTINDDILGSLEFSCSIAGAKVIVVLGHTNCGAIKGACDNVQTGYLKGLMSKLRIAVDAENTIVENRTSKNHLFVNTVAHINVKSTVKAITEKSSIINALIENKKVAIVGAMYDVESGRVNFYEDPNE